MSKASQSPGRFNSYADCSADGDVSTTYGRPVVFSVVPQFQLFSAFLCEDLSALCG